MSQRLHILFVTRKFPPSTGGMERAAFELHAVLASNNQVTLVKWGGSNRWLPLLYPYLLVCALWQGLRRCPDVIYLQDGLMAPIGWLLKQLLHRPTVITIHGKEATYANPLYKRVVLPCIARQSALVVVSNETKQQVLKALPLTKPTVIFNGVTDIYAPDRRESDEAIIADALDMSLATLKQRKLLHTNGRLVPRKGVRQFIDNVLPQLAASDPSILYIVSGEGSDRPAIEAAIKRHKLQHNVALLGWVTDKLAFALFNAIDLFIMPNVSVAGDIEGFGLVAINAAACGNTVIASNLEGIKDAITDGKNGFLLPAGDADAYVKTIQRELKRSSLDPAKVRAYTLKHYSWSETARQYEAVMRSLLH